MNYRSEKFFNPNMRETKIVCLEDFNRIKIEL